MRRETLIKLENITVRLYDTFFLRDFSWEIKRNENWAIVGPNGSGKTTLGRTLAGTVPVVRGRVLRHFPSGTGGSRQTAGQAVGYVSPELVREVLCREEGKMEARDFSGRPHERTSVAEVIGSGMNGKGPGGDITANRVITAARRAGIANLLDRDFSVLSSGELSKVMIARALVSEPEILILDEPFNGLDGPSREALAFTIEALMGRGGLPVILITHRPDEIVPGITHLLCLEAGRMKKAGLRDEVLPVCRARPVRKGDLPQGGRPPRDCSPPFFEACSGTGQGEILIRMVDVRVRYGEVKVLNGFNWQMRRGENWAILGPNGAGKSTVLGLIYGDNLQVYSNQIYLFGKRRGAGDSLREIRHFIGMVSQRLHAAYSKDVRALDVILSGFHDSIGLYCSCTAEQGAVARQWIDFFGIGDLVEKNFQRLSNGQRQLILIARAMVKSPLLLLMDEPCEGLDAENRQLLMEAVNQIGTRTKTDLVYVTHLENEIPACITHILHLESGTGSRQEFMTGGGE